MHTVIVFASPHVHLLCLENAFSLQVFTTYGSYNSLPLKQGTPNFDGRAYDKGTPCSLSLSIIQFRTCVLLTIYFRRSFSDER